MKYFIKLFCLSFLLSSCFRVYIDKPNEINTLFKNILPVNGRVNFEGIFQKNYEDIIAERSELKYKDSLRTPFLYKPIIFFNSGIISMSSGYIGNDSLLYYNMDKFGYKKKDFGFDWGTFTISGDTINATVYTTYEAIPNILMYGGIKKLQSHFQGVLRNSDNIINWHMVPPYPKVLNRADQINEILESQKPINLIFRKIKIDGLIDPSKAWINKYKTK
jgi:hypothetical protein